MAGKITVGTPKRHRVWAVPVPGFLFNDLRELEGTGAVKRCQAADEGFPTLTPHGLRHTAASLAIQAGANVKAVQRMLGHASAAMALDVYADLFDDDLDVVVGALDDAQRAHILPTLVHPQAPSTTPNESRQLA